MQGYTTRKWSVTIPIRSTIICGHSIYSSTGRRRGGSCLGIIYIYILYILYIYIYISSTELACAVRQRGPWLRALCESASLVQMSHLKLHTSHYTLHKPHFTLQTSSHLISSELFSPHLSSSHLMPSLLMRHLIVLLNYFQLIGELLDFSHLTEALLNSSQLFCASESFWCQRKDLEYKNRCTQNGFAQRSLWTQKLET